MSAISELQRALSSKRFVFTGEIEPLKTTSIEEFVETAKILKGNVIAANVTDNPTAFAYMNSLVPCYLIEKETGLESIFQVTTRDRNRLALIADLLAAAALGIKNVLALSGDHTSLGDNPQSKAVYDLDSTQLVYMIRRMIDEGKDLAGNKIHNPPRFYLGGALNLGADPIEPEIIKIEKKVELGVEFFQTQVMYEIDQIKEFFKLTSHLKTPVIVGICPLKSIAMAKWMEQNVPGVSVPKEMMERMRQAKEKGGKEAIIEENITIFGEFCKEIRKTTPAAGIHVMAVGFEWIVPKIIEASGLRVKEGILVQRGVTN